MHHWTIPSSLDKPWFWAGGGRLQECLEDPSPQLIPLLQRTIPCPEQHLQHFCQKLSTTLGCRKQSELQSRILVFHLFHLRVWVPLLEVAKVFPPEVYFPFPNFPLWSLPLFLRPILVKFCLSQLLPNNEHEWPKYCDWDATQRCSMFQQKLNPPPPWIYACRIRKYFHERHPIVWWIFWRWFNLGLTGKSAWLMRSVWWCARFFKSAIHSSSSSLHTFWIRGLTLFFCTFQF